MDAKTIDLGNAKTLTLTVEYQDGTIDIITDSQLRPLFNYFEQQAEDAVIGRAAYKALELLGVAGLGYSDDESDSVCWPAPDANSADDPCNDPNCPWFKFCRLRAERSGEDERNGED